MESKVGTSEVELNFESRVGTSKVEFEIPKELFELRKEIGAE